MDMTTIQYEQAAHRVREIVRAECYHLGSECSFEDVAKRLPSHWPAQFIMDQCELAGFPLRMVER